jgi:OOP family OmpA-OmpF porin
MIRNALLLLLSLMSANVTSAKAAGESESESPVNTITLNQSQEKFMLSGDALFAFDKATLNPSALWQLDKLAEKFKRIAQLEQVILVGHTDRLRSDGHFERNQMLSEQRAANIKKYLVGKGIAADKILASGAGSTQPVVQCSTKASKEKQIVCLQPNRRVEIILRGGKAMGGNK